jgi:hypothetical protein
VIGSTIEEIITGHGGDDDMPQTQPAGGLGHALGFLRVDGSGLAVLTAQNLQARVQWSPPIMNVAVPLLQHSH